MAERNEPDRAAPGAESLFRLLVESVKDYSILALDPEGRIATWNEGARRIKGYKASEVLGEHFSVFYPPRDVRRGKPEYELRVAAAEGRWEGEGWRLRRDGSRFWASVVITALWEADGRLVGFAKVTRDLSERKRAEDQREQLLKYERAARTRAEETAERLQALQRVTEAALAHLSLDHLLRELLARTEELLAVDTVAILLLEGDELVARAAMGLEEAVERGVRIPVGRGFAGRIAADRTAVIIDDVEHAEVLNPVLREKHVRSLLGAPLLVEGRVLGVLHVGSLHRRRFTREEAQLLQLVADRAALAIEHARRYETERAAHERAEAALAARDELITIAAHELKTPLATILAHAQLLLRHAERGRTELPPQAVRSLRAIERQVGTYARLVDRLLDLRQIRAGRLSLQRQMTDLAPLVRQVAEDAQAVSARHEIRVSSPSELPAWVDPRRLEQALVNLLGNAIKYSPHGGPIDLEAAPTADGRWVELSVRDRGIGIPPERRPGLFEPFYRAHADSYASGIGLGLYVSREIAELHGGQLRAEFPEDGGARFVVRLPSKPSPAEPARPATADLPDPMH